MAVIGKLCMIPPAQCEHRTPNTKNQTKPNKVNMLSLDTNVQEYNLVEMQHAANIDSHFEWSTLHRPTKWQKKKFENKRRKSGRKCCSNRIYVWLREVALLPRCYIITIRIDVRDEVALHLFPCPRSRPTPILKNATSMTHTHTILDDILQQW